MAKVRQLGKGSRISSEFFTGRYDNDGFFTGKYDDIKKDERMILAKMSERPTTVWRFNEFRNISSLGNDGKAISALLSGLVTKQYLKRINKGWLLREY